MTRGMRGRGQRARGIRAEGWSRRGRRRPPRPSWVGMKDVSREPGRGEGQGPGGTSGGQKVLELGKRAKRGRAALGRLCGGEETAEEAPALGGYSGRGARLLRGRGEGPSQERTLSQAVRKPRGRQTMKKPRRGALRGRVGDESSAPTRARHAGSAPAARGRASRQRLRQEQKQKGGS